MTDLTEADKVLCEALELSARIAKLEALADKLAEALEVIEPWIGEIRERPIMSAENIRDAWIVYAKQALAAHTLHKIDG